MKDKEVLTKLFNELIQKANDIGISKVELIKYIEEFRYKKIDKSND